MKRTNVVLDERLLAQGKKMTGLKTARAVIDCALRDLVRRQDQRQILELYGAVDWRGDLAGMRAARRVK